ncbi:MAG: peptide chain release factor N(5)-glutamine methyltransferase [Candidatus Babeliales bacterium]
MKLKQPISTSTLFTDVDTQLRTVYPDPILCEQYTWWTLEAVTGKNKAQLLTHTITLTEHQQEKLATWLHALVHEHMPIQYLIGSVPFNNCDIVVETPILIPRPETEEWCSNLITQLKQNDITTFTLLDLCSGTGCIAIALAKAFPHAQIYAADINPQAVSLSKKNAEHNNCNNITVIESDLFNSIPAHLRFDLIVANPPYIDPADEPTLDSSVTQWEDPRALFAANHGLAITQKIIEQSSVWLTDNKEMRAARIPQLMIEIDCTQADAVTTLMYKNNFTESTIHKDLEGKDRVISGRLSNVAVPHHF